MRPAEVSLIISHGRIDELTGVITTERFSSGEEAVAYFKEHAAAVVEATKGRMELIVHTVSDSRFPFTPRRPYEVPYPKKKQPIITWGML